MYIVYECDDHQSYDSFCMKLMTGNKKMATNHFNLGAKRYQNKGDGWMLVLAEYEPRIVKEFDNDVIREFNILKTSE